jgi:uncharacterized protein
LGKDCLLVVFVKNRVKGKVKTRLAKSIGNEKALQVYEELIGITVKVSSGLDCRKQVWYSDGIEEEDSFERDIFEKYAQEGEGLGMRMKRAIARGFDEGFEKVVIIGSDCPEITPEILEMAFQILDSKDAVIGPSEDGGYYLLGLNKFIPQVFLGIDWSTSGVLEQTIGIIEGLNFAYSLLPELNDIDTLEDLEKSNLIHVSA